MSRRWPAVALVVAALAGAGRASGQTAETVADPAMTTSAATTTSVATSTSVSTTTSAATSTTSATAATSTTAATTATVVGGSATTTTASQDLRPGPPVTLSVRTLPAKATVVLRTADGSGRSGPAPLTVSIPSGPTELTILAPGYISRREVILLQGPTTVTRWLDPVGQLLAKRYEAATGSNPKQVVFTPDGTELWVPLLGSRGVEVFEAATGRRFGLIRLGAKGGAVEVVFTRDSKTAYVSQMETASVYQIDRASRRVTRVLRTGGVWTKVLALSPDERTLYAANWVSNDVSEIDISSGQVRRRIPTVRTPRGLALSPDGRRLFVAGFDKGEIQRIDLATGASAVVLRTGQAMRHLVVDPASNLLYADDMGSDELFVIDLATEKGRRLGATDSHPNTIDLSPDGRVLYVSNRGANGATYSRPGPEWGSVLAIDTATGAVLDAVVAGNQTTGLDASPDGRLLAYTDFMDNRLVVYELPGTDALLAGAGGRASVYRPLLRKS